MKKFKLIKEYPNSPKLGTVVESPFFEYGCGYMVGGKLFEEPLWTTTKKFWQEIIEKDYEINSFINDTGVVFTLQSNNTYKDLTIIYDEGYKLGWRTLTHMLKIATRCRIHSVKRLSDGKVFTVGDKVNITNEEITKGWDRNPTHKVTLFFLNDDETLRIICTTDVAVVGDAYQAGYKSGIFILNDIKKSTPLFTTEDGVDIFEGDVFAHTSGSTEPKVVKATHKHLNYSLPMDKIFSTKEKAEEYVLMNKQCLSINNIISTCKAYITPDLENSLKQMVKKTLEWQN